MKRILPFAALAVALLAVPTARADIPELRGYGLQAADGVPHLAVAPTAMLGAALAPAVQLTAPADAPTIAAPRAVVSNTGLGVLGTLGAVAAIGFGLTTAPGTPAAPADDPHDPSEPAVTNPLLDKKLYALLLGLLAPLVLKFTGVAIDPNLLAGFIVLLVAWYMKLHNDKTTKITVANVEGKATVNAAKLNAAAGASPASATAAQDAIGRG